MIPSRIHHPLRPKPENYCFRSSTNTNQSINRSIDSHIRVVQSDNRTLDQSINQSIELHICSLLEISIIINQSIKRLIDAVDPLKLNWPFLREIIYRKHPRRIGSLRVKSTASSGRVIVICRVATDAESRRIWLEKGEADDATRDLRPLITCEKEAQFHLNNQIKNLTLQKINQLHEKMSVIIPLNDFLKKNEKNTEKKHTK